MRHNTQSAATEHPDSKKPWLRIRDGETPEQYDHRIARSCYNCGQQIENSTALDQHEDRCPRQPDSTN